MAGIGSRLAGDSKESKMKGYLDKSSACKSLIKNASGVTAVAQAFLSISSDLKRYNEPLAERISNEAQNLGEKTQSIRQAMDKFVDILERASK